MADIFDVVADTTRRDLLQALLDRYLEDDGGAGEVSVGELVDLLELSQPTVSKHLKVLRDNGLVSVREEGQHRFYRLDAAPLEALEDWLIPFLSADFDSEGYDGAEADSTDFDGDAEGAASAGPTVFAAWSGSRIPEPLRRVADSIEHSADAGTAVGRSVAEATHQVRSVIEGASHALEEVSETIERKVINPIREKFSKHDGTS